MSTREAARVFGLHRDVVSKMLRYSAPPGYCRQSAPRRPKLDPYRGVIDRILEDDRSLPKKLRHTAKRIYERLRAEHGFSGKYTIVKDYVRERRRRADSKGVRDTHPFARGMSYARIDESQEIKPATVQNPVYGIQKSWMSGRCKVWRSGPCGTGCWVTSDPDRFRGHAPPDDL